MSRAERPDAPLDREPAQSTPRGRITPLPGVMTGLSNTVNDRLGDLSVPAAVTRVARLIARRSFGNAGLSRQQGREDAGLSCPYDRAEFARVLRMDGSNLRRCLRWLEEGLIIRIEETAPGEGRIAWRIQDMAAWHAHGAGGARPGAGAKPGNTHALKHGRYSRNAEQASAVNLIVPPSERGQFDSFESIKLTAAASSGAASIQAPEALPIIPYNNPEVSPNGDTVAPAKPAQPLPASSGAQGTKAPPRSTRPRKLTDEQLVAHQAEQGYCAELLKALAEAMGYASAAALPARDAQKAAAKWFYKHAQPDGAPAPVHVVIELYRVTKAAEWWRSRPLSLHYLTRAWPDWMADPARYARDLGDARKQASRTWNGRPVAPAAPPVVASGSSIWNKARPNPPGSSGREGGGAPPSRS